MTVTVDTTSASTVHPTNSFKGINLRPINGGLALMAISLLATLLIGTFRRNFQWNAAWTLVATVAFSGWSRVVGTVAVNQAARLRQLQAQPAAERQHHR